MVPKVGGSNPLSHPSHAMRLVEQAFTPPLRRISTRRKLVIGGSSHRIMSNNPLDNLVEDFAQTLVDCRQLYRSAAHECTLIHDRPMGKTRREFVQLMDDLHQGLLVKVYMDIAVADQSWQPEEQRLATVLIEHLWNRHLEDGALREAMRGLRKRSRQLDYRAVIEPFVDFACLREHMTELATIVLRAANLVAKADGQLTASESEQLHRLQETFERLLLDANEKRHDASISGKASVGPNATDYEFQVQPEATAPPPIPDPPRISLEDAMQELDDLIGLPEVKKEIRTLANFLKIQKQRESAGLPQTPLSLHLVFNGNPGTGKTTVARIVGQIYRAMEVLERGHLIETDRSGLVAEYAGQTAGKTNEQVDQAIGGVLFVDEAYSLVSEQGDDAYGREALQTLLKRMEDDREQLAVIIAGYPQPMAKLLQANPGLTSRFGRQLSFNDYPPLELAEIFACLCEQHRYALTWEVRFRLLAGFEWLYHNRDEHFGNGRLARNLFEDAIRHLSNRIVDQTPITHELLTRFHPSDLPMKNVPARHWEFRRPDNTTLQSACDGCESRIRLKPEHLGRKFKCPKCSETIEASWGTFAEPFERASD